MPAVFSAKDVGLRERNKLTNQLHAETDQLDADLYGLAGIDLNRAGLGSRIGAGAAASASHRIGTPPTSEERYNGSRTE